MKTLSVQSTITEIRQYLENTVATPFFVIVDGNKEYAEILREFGQTLEKIHSSDFCADDAFPDYDALENQIRRCGKHAILVGLGEAVALSGDSFILGKLKDIYLESKVIILCRGIRRQILAMANNDPKFDSRRFCMTESDGIYEIWQFSKELDTSVDAANIKELLAELETGNNILVTVKSEVPLKAVKQISSAYEALKLQFPEIPLLPQTCLEEWQWRLYLKDSNCEKYPIAHWRTYLKYAAVLPKEPYLQYVLKRAASYDEYQKLIFNGLLDVSPKDKVFPVLYQSRKELLKGMQDADIAGYVAETTVRDDDRIYYLTDNTPEERHEIIKEIGKMGEIPSTIYDIYPALGDYLQNYGFFCKHGDRITDYFSRYKLLKFRDRIPSDFMDMVLELAKSGNRIYNSLPTRGALLEQFDSAKDTLYWMDALGVEFLGYIQKRAGTLGLEVHIQIGRAELPTLTCFNRDFYDNWQGPKEKTRELDRLKHEGHQISESENKCPYPIHLSEELTIIDHVLMWMKTELESKRSNRIVLTSDHGASRLAVINNKENKWRMATDGKHSGRCCPTNEIDEKPDCATDERGFWVLANYDRFKGGRKANVEVHGGATLEEVLVPVIAFSLKDKNIDIKNLTPITYSDNLELVPSLILYSAYYLENVSVYFNNKHYQAVRDENNVHKFHVSFPDFRKSGTYTAEVYVDDNREKEISFKIERKSAGRRQDQDDFFN